MVECLNNVDIHLLECIGDELFVGQRHRLYIKYIYFYSLWAKTKLSTKVTPVGGSNPAIPHVIEVGGDNQSFQGVIGGQWILFNAGQLKCSLIKLSF